MDASQHRQHAADPHDEDLRLWVDAVHQLPGIRVDKVVAVREALRQSRYDNEHILARTIERVWRALDLADLDLPGRAVSMESGRCNGAAWTGGGRAGCKDG